MKKKSKSNKNAICLEEMRLIVPEQNVMKSGIFYFIMLMLGTASTFGCFYSSFDVPIERFSATLSAVIFGIVFTAIFLIKRKNTWFVVGSLIFLTLFLIIFRDSIYQGMITTVKYVLEAFHSHGSTVTFPSNWENIIKASNQKFDSTIFLITSLYVFIMLEAWLIEKRRNLILSAFVTLPFILAPIFVPITPAFMALLSLLIFYGMLIFLSPTLSGSKAFRRGMKGYHISSTASANPIAFIIVPIFLVAAMIVAMIFPQSGFQRSKFLDVVRMSIVNGIDQGDFTRYINAAFGGDIDKSNLKNAGNISFKEIRVLNVTMNESKKNSSHTEYLKGYVGSVYTEEGWEDLSAEQSAKVMGILGNNSGQRILSDIRTNYYSDNETRNYYNLTVKCLAGNPRKVYIPYGLLNIAPEEEISFVNDSYAKAVDDTVGIDEYNYNAFSMTEDYEKITLRDRLENYVFNIDNDDNIKVLVLENGEAIGGLGYFGVDDNGYIFFISEDGEYYQNLEKYDPTKDYGNIFYGTNIESDSKNFQSLMNRYGNQIDSKLSDYLYMLDRYESFAKENYTQVPENIKASMEKFIKDNNIKTDSTINTIRDIKKILQYSGRYTYTYSPGTTPEGSDFTEYFLNENKKGYCKHFATAAVMLLRTAGVPSRYVEGFKIENTDFTNSNNHSVDLLDSDAHAWVEVYYSGTGWVPIEVTPTYDENEVSNTSLSESSDESSMESKESSEPSGIASSESTSGSSKVEVSRGSDEEASTGSDIPTILIYIAFVPVCIGIIYGVLVLNRTIRINKRKKKFSDKNRNHAILAVYGYIVELLVYRKKIDNNMSDYDNIKGLLDDENLQSSYKELYELFCERIYPIAQKAKFSGAEISQDELSDMIKFSEKIRSTVMENMNFTERLAAKYLDIL